MWLKYALAQASYDLLEPCSSMLRFIVALTLTSALAQETSLPEGLEAAWEDLKLLLSFAVGIVFMKSLESVVGRATRAHV